MDIRIEMVNRYIYAVMQYLPHKQKADLERELRSLIEDMIEERAAGGADDRTATEEVLKELGHPRALAAKYRSGPTYLIGPAVFDFYVLLLKVVLISALASLTVVFAIELILSPFAIGKHFAGYIVSLIQTSIQVFGWVTFSCAVIEYAGVKIPEVRAKKDWKPSQLPPVPDPAASIKQGEPIFAIILHVLFLVFFTFSLHLFGVVRMVEGEAPTVVPFLNNEVFRGYLPLIWGLAAAGIFLESWKLIARKWKTSIIAAQMLYFVAAYAVAVYLFTNPQIWNSAFMETLAGQGAFAENSELYNTVANIWNWSQDAILVLLAIGTIFEIVRLAWKWMKLKHAK